MTTDELRKSLSDEQAKAFNAALVEMRDSVNAARDVNEQQLAAAHAQEIGAAKDSLAAASMKLTEAITAKDATEKALADEKAAHVLTIENGNKQIEALTAEAKDAVAKSEKNLDDYKAQALAVATAISAAINDPKTDTDSAVTAILHEATKDERTKQRESLVNQKSEIDKQLAELA